MLAQKQPRIKRVRNSSLVEWLGAENVTGLKYIPKLGIAHCAVVEERCIKVEAILKRVVDEIQERMPE